MKPSDTNSKAASRVRVGPAGWSYSDWDGIVYPSRKPRDFHEAGFLSQFVDTIEINTSFYQPLYPPHVKQWIDQVAGNPRFLFTAKLWQGFTHETGASREDEKTVRAGLDVLAQGNRLGAVLMQFPFSFHNTPENLLRLENLIRKFADYPLVVEVRHSSWGGPQLREMLRKHAVGFCNIDQPAIGRSLKPSEESTSPIGYVRLHGRRYDTWFSDDPTVPSHERYNYLYSEEELEPWAKRIHKVASHSKSTFVITNNHYQGKGVVNALELIRILRGEKIKVPETLRHHYPRLERIASEPPLEPTLFPLEPK